MTLRRSAMVVGALLAPALAQLPMPGRWGSVKSFGVDAVNRANLGVLATIPLFNRATVGGAQVNLRLTYNSQFWAPGSPGWIPLSNSGWTLAYVGGQVITDEYAQSTCGWYDPVTGEDDYTGNPDDQSYTIYESDYYFVEPSGAKIYTGLAYYQVEGGGSHPLGWENDCPAGTNYAQSYLIQDGTGYTVLVDNLGHATAYDAKGDEVDGGFVDRNGNRVGTSAAGGATTYSDPLGAAVTVSGAGTPSSPITYQYAGPNSSTAAITEDFQTFTVNTSFGCSPYSEYSGSLTLPIDLKFSDGSEYQFGYDSNGRLGALTLPTGGVIHYSYALSCANLGDGNATLSRWDSVNTSNYPWNWSTSGTQTVQTVETDPYGNDGVFTFGGPLLGYGVAGALLQEADSYSGSHTAGTELRSTTIANTFQSGTLTQQAITTELMDGGVLPNLYAVQSIAYDNFGATTTQTNTDWGTSSAGGATLRTVTAALTAVDGGLADQIETTTVSDGGGQVSKSAYAYDGSGHLLTENDYVTSGGGSLTKSFTYTSNGNIATAADANGAVTTYTYGACGGIFPSLVQSAVSAVKTTVTWNCTGGVPLTSTDGNGLASTATYNDASHLWRPTSITAPDGKAISINYISPNQLEQATTFNSGVSTSDTLVTQDGLGRTFLSQRRQGPSLPSFDTVQTAYDAMNRPISVSMPFSDPAGTGGGGTAFTTTSYDALSRPLAVTDGGGGTVIYGYGQNDVEITAGPAPTVSKQEEFDGLGRLESVCELTSAGGSGACGQTNAQTGFWTKYTRNGRDQITGVAQNAQGTAETRSFSFDQMGRLTAETNPESGTTTYDFDSGADCALSLGDLVERKDAAGNVTCYAYDALHRVTQISYPSGPNTNGMLTKHFVYDAATVDNAAMANVAGKLAEAYTGGHATDLGFSYPNPSADEADVYQSSPNSGGFYITTAQHYANGAVSALTLPTAVPAIAYGLDGEGRPTTVSDGSGKGPVTAASYNDDGLAAVSFGSGDGDAYSYDASTGRMTQYQFQVNGQDDTGALTWNANGTVQKLDISDGIAGTSDSQTCNYGYDQLGRIASADCGANWSQTFSIDPFGNVAKSATTGTSFSASFNVNNQIASVGGVNGVYDADGDLLNDPSQSANTVNTFDAEGKAVVFEGVAVVYDALGRAVEAAEPGGTIEFLYGPGGGKLAVMSGQTLGAAYIPLPGGGTAVYHGSSVAYYRHADGLGSSRLASTPNQTLYSSTAYAPYGEPYDESGPGGPDRSFTGQNQDTIGGQYDFLMRKFSPTQSRWWTPDPAGLAAVDPGDPQSWNRFAYVGGSPLTATDPLGLMRGAATPGCYYDDVDGYVCPPPGGGIGGGGGGRPQPCVTRGRRQHGQYRIVYARYDDGCGDGPGGGGGGGNYQITAQPPKGPVCVSPEAINALLADTPMSGEGQYFYDAGQEYNVNPALAVAIAGAESTFGENTNATWGYWNAWGWGNSPSLHSIGQGWTSWNQGILKVSWQLGMSTKYLGATPPLTTTTAIYANWCTAGNCASGLATINSILSGFGVQPGNSLAFAACTEEGH